MRKHADDDVRLAVSQHVGPAAETSLPRAVSEHHGRWCWRSGSLLTVLRPRPSTGVTPKTLKNPLVTLKPDTRCGPGGGRQNETQRERS
jgi:hypothetical protein